MTRIAAFLLAATAFALPAAAQEPATCKKIIFSDVGWTDITATTAVATTILDSLGYETEIKVLSLPVTFTAMAKGDVDAFLGLVRSSPVGGGKPRCNQGRIKQQGDGQSVDDPSAPLA